MFLNISYRSRAIQEISFENSRVYIIYLIRNTIPKRILIIFFPFFEFAETILASLLR